MYGYGRGKDSFFLDRRLVDLRRVTHFHMRLSSRSMVGVFHSPPAQNQNQHILQRVFGGDSPDTTIQFVWERGFYEGRRWTRFPKHLQIRHWIIDGVGQGVLGARFTYLPLSFLVVISMKVLFISTETLTLLLLPLRQACAYASLPHAD